MTERNPARRTARNAVEIFGDHITGPRREDLQADEPLHYYDALKNNYIATEKPPEIFAPLEQREMVKLLKSLNDTKDPLLSVVGKQLVLNLQPQMMDLFSRIANRIPDEERRQQFALELEKAKAVMQAGVLPSDDIPNLNTPERQLLWAGALGMAWAKGVLGEDFEDSEAVKKVSASKYIRGLVGDFCEHLLTHGYGNVGLVLGPPGSWFYSDATNNLINMDLCFSLCMGGDMMALDREKKFFRCHGHFESIFYHEAGHARLSLTYPAQLREVWNRMRELGIRGGLPMPDTKHDKPLNVTAGEGISFEEYKEFERLSREYRILQHCWNAAEDNVVNAYMRGLSHVEDSLRCHPSQLDDSFNVASVIVNDAGDMIRHYTGDALKDEPKENDPLSIITRRIGNAAHAINMCFYIDNQLLPDKPAGWEALRVDFNAMRENLPQHLKSGMSAQDVKIEFQRVAYAIREAQPDVTMGIADRAPLDAEREKHLRALAEELHLSLPPSPDKSMSLLEQSDYYCGIRNHFIQHFFDRYVEPSMKELRPLLAQQVDQAIEKNRQMRQRGGKGGGGQPIRVNDLPPDYGEMKTGDIPGGSPKADRSKEQQKHSGGKPHKSVGEIGREHKKQRGEQPGKKKKSVNRQGDKNNSGLDISSAASQAAGGASSTFSGLTLGDGRSYAELKADPMFEAVVEEVAERLRQASKNIQQPDTRLGDDSYGFTPPAGIPLGQAYDPARDLHAARKQASGESIHMRDLANLRRPVEYIRSTEGDLLMLVDGSGSMGSGPCSPMEIAMKTAAILKNAGDRAGYRTYIVLWGDQQPNMVFYPGMDSDEEAGNIDAVINGKGCGTLLAPAFPAILQRLKKTPPSVDTAGNWKQHGYTHCFVISDGDTFDDNTFGPMIATIMEKMPMFTVDAAITRYSAGGRNIRFHRSRIRGGTSTALERTLASHTPEDRNAISATMGQGQDMSDNLLDMIEARLGDCAQGNSHDEATYQNNIEEALTVIADKYRFFEEDDYIRINPSKGYTHGRT